MCAIRKIYKKANWSSCYTFMNGKASRIRMCQPYTIDGVFLPSPKKYNRSSQKSSATNTCVNFFLLFWILRKKGGASIKIYREAICLLTDFNEYNQYKCWIIQNLHWSMERIDNWNRFIVDFRHSKIHS